MNEGEEILIEGDGIVYDVANIEEMEHFDIGDEGCSDPEEVAAEDINIWNSEQERGPLSIQQGKKRRERKKPGRRVQGKVITIPRRQPPRAARSKSFQQYDTMDDDEEEEDEIVVQEAEDEIADETLFGDDGEDDMEPVESSSKTWRIFVRKDGSGMHFDWPIYSDTAITLNHVVSIISSVGSLVSANLICDSIPQEYTNTGTFVVALEPDFHKDDIYDDGLGAWHSAQMFVRKYVVGDKTRRPLMTQKNDHNLKVVCEQFIHPGTDKRGDFIRRIYTGFNKDEHMIPFVVICYEWMGQAHPLTVYEDADKEFEQNTWKKCANSEEQVPIFVKHGCDYNAAVSILLSTERFTEYGKSVPIDVQECISFVLDVNACGGDRALYNDGNDWMRPSGQSKHFRIAYDSAEDQASWRIEKGTIDDCDVQIICRRYVGRKFTESFGFVRKIFLVRILPSCPENVARLMVNSHLAVISYTWRDAPLPTVFQQPTQVERNGAVEEVVMIEEDPLEMRELFDNVTKKKKENREKLENLMHRAHRLTIGLKKNGWDENASEVQEILQVFHMLSG